MNWGIVYTRKSLKKNFLRLLVPSPSLLELEIVQFWPLCVVVEVCPRTAARQLRCDSSKSHQHKKKKLNSCGSLDKFSFSLCTSSSNDEEGEENFVKILSTFTIFLSLFCQNIWFGFFFAIYNNIVFLDVKPPPCESARSVDYVIFRYGTRVRRIFFPAKAMRKIQFELGKSEFHFKATTIQLWYVRIDALRHTIN